MERKKRRVDEKEPFYNTVPCQRTLKSKKGTPCKHMAYFVTPGGEYVCGQHSLDVKATRRKLIKDPNEGSRRVAELNDHRLDVLARVKENLALGAEGSVACFRMTMMGAVPLVKGRLNVFPNNKHGSRQDGYGCPHLSPMRLGPVNHRQPGLPPAKNIENYHQYNKVWPCEVDKDGNPDKEYEKRRLAGYKDPEPHRHKFDAKTMVEMRKKVAGENRNAPLYSVHSTLDGEERRFTYVQSRYFYCYAYEALAKRTKSFETLTNMKRAGYDLRICGYDAYPVTKSLYEHYCDPTKPFGHEMVLYTLLCLDGEVEPYPWHVYRDEHPDVYEGIASVLTDEDNDEYVATSTFDDDPVEVRSDECDDENETFVTFKKKSK